MRTGKLTLSALIGSALAAALLFAVLLFPTSASATVPPPFWKKCETGTGGGECQIPRGIAVDPDSGHLYVADQENHRINELTVWGEFLRAWGWDVIASGPGDDAVPPEDQLEVCVPGNGDVCKAGTAGGGPGQLTRPQGLALESEGHLYVAEGDFGKRRVQKFDLRAGPSEDAVQFVLMFGGKVNKTKVEEAAPAAAQNLCPVAPGDVCQEAASGSGPGEFGTWVAGSYIALDPSDHVLVGDVGRIQEFEPDGSYRGEISGGALTGGIVQSLAIDSAGGRYVALSKTVFISKEDVLKLGAAGEVLCTGEVGNPRGIAIGLGGGIYVIDEVAPTQVRQFDSACADKQEPFAVGEITESTGIATSAACGVEGVSVYLSNSVEGDSFIRAYGNLPDPTLCPPPAVPPSITDQYATAVDSISATLKAKINPHFWSGSLGATTYYLEYGTSKCSEGGCTEQQPLPPGAKLNAGVVDEDITAGITLGGLSPATTYHYRFVAASEGGGPVTGEEASFTTFPAALQPQRDCPNQAFRTAASAPLPDCRAYELVSPVDKNGGDIVAFGRGANPRYSLGLEQSSLDGERITYSSTIAFADALGAPYTSQYIASRQAGQGWSTHAISAPRGSKSISGYANLKFEGEYKAFSPDLCEAWLQHDSDPILAPGAVEGFVNLYRRSNCGTEGYEAITTVAPPSASAVSYVSEVQGVAASGALTFFTSPDKLTAEAASIAPKSQLYVASDGQLRFVCVLPDGSTSGQACTAGTLNSQGQDGRENSVARAVSADGSRVYWTAYSLNAGQGELFLRTNPEQEQSALEGGECTEADKACTVAVSAGAAAQFWTASSDGSKAFYSEGEKLFEYDAEEATREQIATGLVEVGEASEDASRLYFASTKALSGEEANSEGDKAVAGEPNLYLYDAVEETTTFVGTLSGKDVKFQSPLQPVSQNPMLRASRVSPDGSVFAFTSTASLTGYDNTDANSGKADTEVFLYEAGSKALVCVSCNASGARPTAGEFKISAEVQPQAAVAAQIPTWENQLYAPRVLSEDGTRLYFESFDPLLPRDTNGHQDVYEWQRAPSEEACEQRGAELYLTDAGGCLSLISSGQGPVDSEFSDASPDGHDVFFRTAAGLLPQDPGLIDLYDARMGGGFPQPQAKASCEGEACQGPLAPPNDPTPASSSYQGAGNVIEQPAPRCTKPKARRKGRCVAKKQKRTHQAKHRTDNSNGRAGR